MNQNPAAVEKVETELLLLGEQKKKKNTNNNIHIHAKLIAQV